MHASTAKEVKARRYAQHSEYRPGRASSPAQPGRCCGVNCFAIKHNGLLHKVRPVTALKLRLVSTPLRFASRPSGSRNPRYVLRPYAPAAQAKRSRGVAHGLRRTSMVSVPVPVAPAQVFWSGASRSHYVCAPAHPVGLALARPGRAGAARPPPKGVPSTPALGARFRWPAWCLCRLG